MMLTFGNDGDGVDHGEVVQNSVVDVCSLSESSISFTKQATKTEIRRVIPLKK